MLKLLGGTDWECIGLQMVMFMKVIGSMENVMGKVGFRLHVHFRDFPVVIRFCGLRVSFSGSLFLKCVVWKMKIRHFIIDRSDDVRSWWQHLEWDVVRRCPTRRFWIVQHRGRDVVPNVLRHGQVWPIVTHLFSLLLMKYHWFANQLPIIATGRR